MRKMSSFRIILILVLGIAIIEALPASKPTLKPNGKPTSKLTVFRLKNKSLLAEEKKIGKVKASKIAVENAEESKTGDRKKKAITFCVEIRPDPINKVCDPAPTTVDHQHHVHQSSSLEDPIPPASSAPPIKPDIFYVPIMIENSTQPPVIVEPPPPSYQFIPQPQPAPIGCIHSSLGPCPPSIYPSGYAHQIPESPDAVRNFFIAMDPMFGARIGGAPNNHIEQLGQLQQPYHGARSSPAANPEIPVNAASPQQRKDVVPTHTVTASIPSQNLPQHQAVSCSSAHRPIEIQGFTPSPIAEKLPIPTGPLMPSPAATWPLGGPRGTPLYPKPAVLSDVSNFQMISNYPDVEIPVGYQTSYHGYDPPQSLAGSQIAPERGSYGQRIRLQRQQTEESKVDENQEQSTSSPEGLTFGDMINRMRVSQDSWRSGSTMQSFPREKTDQTQQLRLQAARVNVNLPSADYPIAPEINLNSEAQSIISNVKEIGQKAIESSPNGRESK